MGEQSEDTPYWMGLDLATLNELPPEELEKVKRDVETAFRTDLPQFGQILFHPVQVPWRPKDAAMIYAYEGACFTRVQFIHAMSKGKHAHLGLMVRFDDLNHALITKRPPAPRIPLIRRIMSPNTQRWVGWFCIGAGI